MQFECVLRSSEMRTVQVKRNASTNPLTHNVHKTWTFMTFIIITHDKGVAKIKEDSSTEREKSPHSIWAYIYHSPMYESTSQDFF